MGACNYNAFATLEDGSCIPDVDADRFATTLTIGELDECGYAMDQVDMDTAVPPSENDATVTETNSTRLVSAGATARRRRLRQRVRQYWQLCRRWRVWSL